MRFVPLLVTLACGCYASHERGDVDASVATDAASVARDAATGDVAGDDADDALPPDCYPGLFHATLEAGHCHAFYANGGTSCRDDPTGHARFDVPRGHEITFEILPSVVGPGATTGGWALYDPASCSCDGMGETVSVPTIDPLHFTTDRRAVEIQFVGVGVGFGVRACISR